MDLSPFLLTPVPAASTHEPMATAATTLTLVRHGEIAANVERVWHGSIDSPLTPRGREQAERVAAHLAGIVGTAAALYTSPLRRAADTAQPIAGALAVPPQVDPALAEYHLGVWEGLTYAELAMRHDFFQRVLADPDFAPEGAESPRHVATRMAAALRRIAAAHPGARVVVVSHGAALNLGLGLLLAGSCTDWSRVMRNGAVSELAFDPAPRLVRFNDAAHLDGL